MTETRFTAPISEAEKQEFIPFVHRLIDAAAEQIMPRFLTAIKLESKDNGTPVTEADREAERAMRALVEAAYPQHGVYGEEFGEKQAAAGTPRYRWVLDPLDGTRSFLIHSFHFGTLVALERDDGEGYRPILSAIAFPAAGVRVVGTRDGTMLTRDREAVSCDAHVRHCAGLHFATLLTTSHWTTDEQVGTRILQALIDNVSRYRTMGDCFGYFAVATGGADVMIDPDLSYWDIAAVLPIVEGAGGVITSMTGGNPLKELSAVCTGGSIHAQVLDILNGNAGAPKPDAALRALRGAD